jgi:hypothetical protein
MNSSADPNKRHAYSRSRFIGTNEIEPSEKDYDNAFAELARLLYQFYQQHNRREQEEEEEI